MGWDTGRVAGHMFMSVQVTGGSAAAGGRLCEGGGGKLAGVCNATFGSQEPPAILAGVLPIDVIETFLSAAAAAGGQIDLFSHSSQKLLDTYAELQTDFPPPPETAQNAAAEAPQAAAAPAIAAAQEQPAATKAEGGIGDKAAVDVAAEAAALSEGKTATETNSAAAAEEGAPADAGNAAKVTEAAA